MFATGLVWWKMNHININVLHYWNLHWCICLYTLYKWKSRDRIATGAGGRGVSWGSFDGGVQCAWCAPPRPANPSLYSNLMPLEMSQTIGNLFSLILKITRNKVTHHTIVLYSVWSALLRSSRLLVTFECKILSNTFRRLCSSVRACSSTKIAWMISNQCQQTNRR